MSVHRFNDKNLVWLYRYRALDEKSIPWVERIFTHGEMYFAPPSALNDPHELNPIYEFLGSPQQVRMYIERLCTRLYPLLHGEKRVAQVENLLAALEGANLRHGDGLSPEAQAYMKSEIERVGVCCFSEDWSSAPMWAHYSGNSTGICVRFKASATTPFFGMTQRVTYSKDYPRINPITQSSEDRVRRLLLWKGNQWSYEKEWRIVDTDAGPGIRKFPVEYIHSVLLGPKITAEHEKAVRAWVATMKHEVSVRRVASIAGSYQMRLV
ncbi:DUF2971 domain-containing protein [Solimonas sp. K1W22B-7]|uniref:DUF2971 domain-containing protein n=1 Tax=Solimonas sp. K1W22B-7 TaxID=2303331 RepID=UPI000E331342|nr:DUF2971 domain-containing protein [Solimonas sp. K1W22B-7]AXQ28852.1 DUF2971 domain-containing protein [Solimonas sp. K1W22B-7]